MNDQHKLTGEEIDHLLNLVREHWPEVFDYEEGIANHNRSHHVILSQRLILHLAQFSDPARSF